MSFDAWPLKNRYTIRYQYGTYSGTEVVWADDEEGAISKMWQRLKPNMTLAMAYRSAKVVKVEEGV